MKPTWLKFWAEYPDYGTYPNSAAVKKDIDAWNGTAFSHEYATTDYWTRATRITFWSLI